MVSPGSWRSKNRYLARDPAFFQPDVAKIEANDAKLRYDRKGYLRAMLESA